MTAAWTQADVIAGADALLASTVMTGNDEDRPTAYGVNAERVQDLVQVVLEAVAPAIAERANS
jgi:hypothetical protein